MGTGDKMAWVASCCLHKSYIPVAMELQFMKCPMSVASDLKALKALEEKSSVCITSPVSRRVPHMSYFKLNTFAYLYFPLFFTKST